MRSSASRRGLTLLEIVLAVGILAAASAPFLWSMMTSKKGFLASVEEVTATALASRTLQTLQQMPFDRVPVSKEAQLVADRAWDARNFTLPDSRALAESFEQLGPTVSGPALERLLLVEEVPLVPDQAPDGPKLKRVTVLVQWTPAFGSAEPFSRTVRLVTLLAAPGK